MKRHYIKSILLFILVFLLCLALFSTYWALDTFNFYSFDEVLFQLTTPIKSASSSILESYLIRLKNFGFPDIGSSVYLVRKTSTKTFWFNYAR